MTDNMIDLESTYSIENIHDKYGAGWNFKYPQNNSEDSLSIDKLDDNFEFHVCENRRSLFAGVERTLFPIINKSGMKNLKYNNMFETEDNIPEYTTLGSGGLILPEIISSGAGQLLLPINEVPKQDGLHGLERLRSIAARYPMSNEDCWSGHEHQKQAESRAIRINTDYGKDILSLSKECEIIKKKTTRKLISKDDHSSVHIITLPKEYLLVNCKTILDNGHVIYFWTSTAEIAYYTPHEDSRIVKLKSPVNKQYIKIKKAIDEVVEQITSNVIFLVLKGTSESYAYLEKRLLD